MANETGPSLGEFLRQEREKRGVTIEQVASATKISARLLHLLESDNYSEMPAKPFIRGFVNSYCRFVGLDSKEVLTRFGNYIDQQAQERPARDSGHSGYAFERRDGEQSRMILVIVLVTFMVLGGVAYFFLKPSLHHGRSAHIERLRAAHPEQDGLDGASPGPQPSSSEGIALENGASSMNGGSSSNQAGFPQALLEQPAANVSASPSPSPTQAKAVAPEPPKPSPSPTPSPSPSPTQAKPSPSPTPTPTSLSLSLNAPAGAAPAVLAFDNGSGRVDKLNSGVNLKADAMKYKLVFKALDHVWVRYQVDDRPVTKFVLRRDSVLVLHVHEKVRVQVSDPKSVTFSVNSSPYRALLNEQSVAARQNDRTMIIPAQDSDSIENPFPGEKSLLGAPVPLPRPTE
jgi:cytoskeletal protein RodZ